MFCFIFLKIHLCFYYLLKLSFSGRTFLCMSISTARELSLFLHLQYVSEDAIEISTKGDMRI